MSALGLTKQDLHQLANCEPKTHWIGLKHEKGVDQPRITVIEKSEYTCWNRLISYLGLGPLAATDFDLHRTFFFVMDRDWKSYIDGDKNSEEFIAYSKVSALVNQLSDHLCERYCKRAANNVFVEIQKEISRDPFKDISPNPLKGTFYWNPALTVGDLRNQLGRQFGFLNLSEFQIVEKTEGVSTLLTENQLLTQDMLRNVDISIRSADVITHMESYDPATQMIGFKKGKQEHVFTILEKKDFTCWNRLQGYFRRGKLADIDFSLGTVLSYLERHEWKLLASNPASDIQSIYDKVWGLAIKALHSNHSILFFGEISDENVNNKVVVNRQNGNEISATNKHENWSLPWNKRIRVKDIQMRLNIVSGKINDKNGRPFDPNHHITKQELEEAQITITRDF